MTHFFFLKISNFRIRNGHFLVFASYSFFVFEIGTFSIFEIATFFVFDDGTFRISKLHISFLIIRMLRDKVTWEMSTFGMLTFEISSSKGKANLENLKRKSQGFKFEVTK